MNHGVTRIANAATAIVPRSRIGHDHLLATVATVDKTREQIDSIACDARAIASLMMRVVAVDDGLDALEDIPIDVAVKMLFEHHLPLALWELLTVIAGSLGVGAHHPARPSEDVGSGIGGIAQDAQNRAGRRSHKACPVLTHGPSRKQQAMCLHMPHDFSGLTQLQKQTEDQRKALLHLQIWVLDHRSIVDTQEAHRKLHHELSTLCLVVHASIETSAQGMKLKLRNNSLHSQKESPVGRGRIVDSVAVADEALVHRAQIEQRIPVTAVAGQTRTLVT